MYEMYPTHMEKIKQIFRIPYIWGGLSLLNGLVALLLLMLLAGVVTPADLRRRFPFEIWSTSNFGKWKKENECKINSVQTSI